MTISFLFVEFIFYSMLGWIWESIYCTIKERKWQDRGFLFGPICPIYGSCMVVVTVFVHFLPQVLAPDRPIWQIFLICMIGSAIAEYSTSFVLEKRFHARWWDYSTQPLNINGRICLPVSLSFGAAGVVIVKYLVPIISHADGWMPMQVYECLAVVFAALFGADFALTEASLSTLLKEIENMHEEFNDRAQAAYINLAATPRKITEAPKKLEEALQDKTLELKETIADKTQDLKDELSEKKQDLMEDFADKAQGLKGGLSEKKQDLMGGIADRKQGLKEELSEKKQGIMENLAEKKNEGEQLMKALAGTHADSLGARERHVLRSIKKFNPAKQLGECNSYDELGMGNRLKLALNLKDSIRHKTEKKDLDTK